MRINAGHLGDVGAGKHKRDAGELFRTRLIDTDDPGVGIRTAQDSDMQHAGHFDIADMEHLAGDFLPRVFSINRLPYDSEICHYPSPLLNCSMVFFTNNLAMRRLYHSEPRRSEDGDICSSTVC